MAAPQNGSSASGAGVTFGASIDRIEQWLSARRVKAAIMIVLAGNIAATITWIARLRGLIDYFHQPLGGDFIIFYAASSLTLTDQAVAAFSPDVLLAAERAVVAGTPAGLVWSYPPPFQMLIAPLALMPFVLAYALWSGLGVTSYLATLRRFSTGPWTLLAACAFPGLVTTLWHGQTTLFVMAVLGSGLIALDSRPWRAGLILGLLICKPQFALLLPFIVVGTGRWRSMIGAAITVLVLGAVSLSVFGVSLWEAFLNNLAEASSWVSSGALPWAKVPTLFVTLAWLGVPEGPAWAVQTAVAVVLAAATLAAWRQPGPLALKAAILATATLMVTPYVLNYDLVLLAIPITALAEYGTRAKLPRGTRLIMGLAFATPTLFLAVAERTHLQLTPIALLIVFAGVWRVYQAALGGRHALPAQLDRAISLKPRPGAGTASVGGL